jgi:hydrogenase maturation factor HypF (carbamoyltransferase family)
MIICQKCDKQMFDMNDARFIGRKPYCEKCYEEIRSVQTARNIARGTKK